MRDGDTKGQALIEFGAVYTCIEIPLVAENAEQSNPESNIFGSD